MAFLQRVINGGGKIHREYALGRKRVDLLIEWSSFVKTTADKPPQRIVIELKIRRSEKTIEEGLEQTAQYMDKNNATEGHLIVFDRSPEKPWNDKIFNQERTINNHTITVWGM